MTDWQLKMDLSDFWHKYPDEITVQELSKKLVSALKVLEIEVKERFLDYLQDLEEITDEFQAFAEGKTKGDIDEFDYLLEDLYDWADISLDNDRIGGKKLCWINTFRKA